MSGAAYAPGLAITSSTEIEKLRELPLPGKVLVQLGDSVDAHQTVLTAELPGELEIVRVADRLGLPPEDSIPHIRVQVGAAVTPKELLAEHRSLFGIFITRVEAPCEGTVEFITPTNAHIGIRKAPRKIEIQAYVKGVVSEIRENKSVAIRAHGALIQGIFGVGGERFGKVLPLPFPPEQVITQTELKTLQEGTTENVLKRSILVGGSSFTIDALSYAASQEVSAVITGSIDSVTLKAFVGYDIGVSITGDENVPFTLIITEGFGKLAISPRILDLARTLGGKMGSVSGATQVRAGALRPELFVAHTTNTERPALLAANNSIEVGKRIRIIRVPYFGQFGTIVEMPHTPEEIPCGAVVRVLRAKLDSGQIVSIPRANVELAD